MNGGVNAISSEGAQGSARKAPSAEVQGAEVQGAEVQGPAEPGAVLGALMAQGASAEVYEGGGAYEGAPPRGSESAVAEVAGGARPEQGDETPPPPPPEGHVGIFDPHVSASVPDAWGLGGVTGGGVQSVGGSTAAARPHAEGRHANEGWHAKEGQRAEAEAQSLASMLLSRIDERLEAVLHARTQPLEEQIAALTAAVSHLTHVHASPAPPAQTIHLPLASRPGQQGPGQPAANVGPAGSLREAAGARQQEAAGAPRRGAGARAGADGGTRVAVPPVAITPPMPRGIVMPPLAIPSAGPAAANVPLLARAMSAPPRDAETAEAVLFDA